MITTLYSVQKVDEPCHNMTMRLAEMNRLVLLLSVLVLIGLLGMSVTLFFFFAISPRDIGGVGVTAWFVSLFCALVAVLTLIRYVLRVRKVESQYRLERLRVILRSSFIISLFLVIALAMQSLRALSAGDVVLFLLTLAIIEIYFRTK